ncbi:DUF6682 family protein [Oceanidesulfovibrio marinus]|uniref:Uncharacterized protein n=1 Tax=Oceanidesulfovibrio marinus TaxID=370038 RepID=A0A6P1ZML0_9BACT|nr:DUF6682 family protein [Oceanidesulfovibrio marinus]TVM35607.1 hypothetical protein DQK91_02785 [Oceanidesulfovibrio marinus]
MALLASDILDDVSRELNDPGRVRWTLAGLFGFLTAAMRQTVLLRPDAYAAVEVMLLTPGTTRQSIPDGAVRFMGLVRNMGSDGATPGFPIPATTREALDASMATWHQAASGDAIDNFTFDPDTPTIFYVTPPPGENVYVEIEVAKNPMKVTALTDALPLPDVWAEPLREYTLYRCYGVNAASATDGARAAQHLQQFYLVLGEEAKAKALRSPFIPTYKGA